MRLLIRADTQDAELYIYDESDVEKASHKWQCGRELSIQLMTEINNICNSVDKNIDELSGIIVYRGPGSYTGLRISISVANSLGYSQYIPVVGSTGETWREDGLEKISNISKFSPVSPEYGGEVYTTKPKK